MFEMFADLLRGLVVSLLIALVLWLALPGAKAGLQQDVVSQHGVLHGDATHGAGKTTPGH